MLVSEIFTSIQGEGTLWIGRPVVFLRLHGCPHKCSFCDTKYSWTPEHEKKPHIMDADEILGRMAAIQKQYPNIDGLIITGGEPLYGANGEALPNLINKVNNDLCFEVMIETSGTELPAWFFGNCQQDPLVTVSPKPTPDGAELLKPHPDVAKHTNELKFLMGYSKSKALHLIQKYITGNDFYWTDETGVKERLPSFCIQPLEYANDHERTRQARINAIEAAKELGFRLSMQIHKVLNIP